MNTDAEIFFPVPSSFTSHLPKSRSLARSGRREQLRESSQWRRRRRSDASADSTLPKQQRSDTSPSPSTPPSSISGTPCWNPNTAGILARPAASRTRAPPPPPLQHFRRPEEPNQRSRETNAGRRFRRAWKRKGGEDGDESWARPFRGRRRGRGGRDRGWGFWRGFWCFWRVFWERRGGSGERKRREGLWSEKGLKCRSVCSSISPLESRKEASFFFLLFQVVLLV